MKKKPQRITFHSDIRHDTRYCFVDGAKYVFAGALPFKLKDGAATRNQVLNNVRHALYVTDTRTAESL